MNTNKWTLLRKKILQYMEFAHSGLEKNAMDALLDENPFLHIPWKQLYDLFRNNRVALLELHLLLFPEAKDHQFFTDKSVVKIVETEVDSFIDIDSGIRLLCSKKDDSEHPSALRWLDDQQERHAIVCNEYAVPEYLSSTFQKLTATPRDLIRLYLLIKVDNKHDWIDPSMSEAELEQEFAHN